MNIAIVGTAGIPASYGGFETLAENLVLAAEQAPELGIEFTVFCSGKADGVFHGARLVGVPLKANGWQSIPYDAISLLRSRRFDVVLLLGVSGAIALPILRLVSAAKIIVNVDGVEWRREKWGVFASMFLRFSQWLAIRFSDSVVVDNDGVLSFLGDTRKCVQIEYGGDHALVTPSPFGPKSPSCATDFFLSICRIEPENNVHVVLEAFAKAGLPLIFVGNWDASPYGQRLRDEYRRLDFLTLCDPIYDLGVLSYLRGRALAYVHGHSAGGTNPSLVEAMHFGRPILAYDCIFNRVTTEGLAAFFSSADDLAELARRVIAENMEEQGASLAKVAQRRFTWRRVAQLYFSLFRRLRSPETCGDASP